jgi:3-hydroxyisobutyrate dehydrogenase-like beta-hydroxyacid dehydrogenase
LVKLTGNFLIASMLESPGVRKSGIDPHSYLDVITNSLFSAPVYKTYGPIIADERYSTGDFKMPLALKDMRLALAVALTPVKVPGAELAYGHLA